MNLVELREAVNDSWTWRRNGVPVIRPEGANIPKDVRWDPDRALADQLIDAERERTSGYGVKKR